MKKPVTISKGYLMEELLRSYFNKAGYFVVRGVPFVYEKFNVTDIDLWLYGRSSSVSREVAIVDIKNKKTPQAIERIFWVQGLKIATKATNAIVATTDRRKEVKEFGKEMGVLVLDGAFLTRLGAPDAPLLHRLSDEDFFSKIDNYSLGKLDGDWKGRVFLCKSLLAKGLSFDCCNEWLLQAKFFAEQAITKPTQKELALRCLYLICSFIAISIDYLMREFSFHDQGERSQLITEGFTYGSKGSAGMKNLLNVALGLVQDFAPDGSRISHQVRTGVEHQLSSLQSTILGEYFSKPDVSKSLFIVAKEFEFLAMQREFQPHTIFSIELRSMFACLLDYWGIDRAMFSDRANTTST